MSESNVRSLVLLTTGRRRDLVQWELQNQATQANVPLLSLSRLSRKVISSDINQIVAEADTDGSAGNRKFNEVLFRATFDCPPSKTDALKDALANCILIRSACEDEVTSSSGIDQLWENLNRMGLSSEVESKSINPTSSCHSIAFAICFLFF